MENTIRRKGVRHVASAHSVMKNLYFGVRGCLRLASEEVEVA